MRTLLSNTLQNVQNMQNAPLLVWAFFLVLATSATTSCRKESTETAQWITPASPASTERSVATELPADPATPQKNAGTTASTAAPEQRVRFLSYNLKNYLTMRRGTVNAPKPEREIEALIKLITAQKPDILGVCEIGKKNDLLDLQTRLKKSGVNLPFSEHIGGRDPTRHLGLLSRYPITATNSQSKLSYQMTGRTWTVSRGFLDATIAINGSELRFLGVHLKSKRPSSGADQELIRQNEARLFRDYADTILTAHLDTQLLAYGDFNDTIASKTIAIARGSNHSKKHLDDFDFADSRGEVWTHFWDYQDIYSRFDYVLFSRALKSKIVAAECVIVDDDHGTEASDHRALMLVLDL